MLRRLLRLFKKSKIIVPNASELEPGTARTVKLGEILDGGTEIAVIRTLDGQVYALNTECPHGQGGRLMPGPLVDGQHIECPMHNFHFDPKTGRVQRGTCASARRYPVTEVDGEFHITI